MGGVIFRSWPQHRIKDSLGCLKAIQDSKEAIKDLEITLSISRSAEPEGWRFKLVGVSAIIRAAIYVMKLDYLNQNLPPHFRDSLKREWEAFAEIDIFKRFIKNYRDEVLKEYRLGSDLKSFRPDGSSEVYSVLTRSDDSIWRLVVKDGFYKGRDYIELAKEALSGIENVLHQALTSVNLDLDSVIPWPPLHT